MTNGELGGAACIAFQVAAIDCAVGLAFALTWVEGEHQIMPAACPLAAQHRTSS